MIINFDMDGTIADLYGVRDWLPKLRAYDPSPYAEAVPLVRLAQLAYYINRAQELGHEVNILSWLSKDPDPAYQRAVTATKLSWLKAHLPSVTFNNIYIIPYGVPKTKYASGILFDDELPNRVAWNAASALNHAYDETVIFEVLHAVIHGEL